jgi:hypothetical protein
VAWFRETVAAAAALLACAVVLVSSPTAQAAGPLIEESWVTGVNSTGATLFMRLVPNGHADFYFEYLTDAEYRANPDDDRFAGARKTLQGGIEFAGARDVSSSLGEALIPATVYHYRPVASNSEGTTVGDEELEHVFVTEETGVTPQLPDARAWEMVSPVDKNGGDIAAPGELFGGGEFQAGGNGTVTYGSATSFGAAAGAPPSSQYVSRRTSAGWVTENVSAPLESAAYGDDPDGAPYRVFSADLSRALLFGGLACRGDLAGCPALNPPIPGSGAPPGYMAYYLRDSANGQFISLLEPGDVAHSAGTIAPAAFEVALAAASPDLSHVVLSSCAALTADANEIAAGSGECDPGATNLYDWSAGVLRAVNVQPGDPTTTPGASIAAPLGAVSADGARIYWSDGARIFLREGGETTWVDEAAGGGGEFQAATPDGALAFFTKAGHLFRFRVADGSLADLTPAGGVVGMLGAAADGSSVYFQDAAGLELWRDNSTTTIAAGADATLPSDYPPATATARVSADGLHLAFLSEAELTEFDNIDAYTKAPDAQLYVYGPPAVPGAAELICASCDPTGERPTGPTSIPGALVNGSTRAYRPRVLSADGLRAFFEIEVAARPGVGRPHVYQWLARGAGGCVRQFGCVAEISGTQPATFVDSSADGTDAYFLTKGSLIGADPGSIDLYDARAGGGFPESSPHIICRGDKCQGLPPEPDDPTPGTLVPTSGNPALRIFSPKAKHRLKRRKHHRHRHRGGRAHHRDTGARGAGR